MTDSASIMNPTGGVDDRRCVTQPALHDDLMSRVLDPVNLRRAWKRVKANRGAPGMDGMRIEDFPAFARWHWTEIRQQLERGAYEPQPVRRVSIPKPGGDERMLGIPIVVDRVIQQAIAQVLMPIFDPGFSESSFGFRPGRSAHGALRQVQGHIQAGCRIACDLDLAKFFDHVQHDVLLARVARKLGDKRLLALIGRYLRAGVLVGESIQATELGTPQGGPLSPLLANILLDDLDKELERRGHRFVRYADDLLILVKSQRAGERVKDSVTRYLTGKLRLVVNEQKSRVVKTNEAKFLGFNFRGTKLRWSDRAFEDFRHHIRKLTGRSWGVSMAYRFHKLAQYVRGWMGYFGISDYYRPIPELDHWLRRRVRMCYWKQWRYVRTKVKNLLGLGTSKRQAILTAISSKSYWHLSRTLATQTGMTNEWLRSQGLISIRDLWMKAHGYA
ncbi:group II intron reverse transcriptase/maturase [Methylocaldum gracile subsp. desertum]|uniref:group II intron reverse transcriptase/maturase n=1 Tax=Methylocaldum sp. GT1BW TaxID=3438964 RepID=UPI003D9FF8FD